MDAILDELQANMKDWQVVFDSQFEPASSRDILRAHSKRYLKLLSDLNESVRRMNIIIIIIIIMGILEMCYYSHYTHYSHYLFTHLFIYLLIYS